MANTHNRHERASARAHTKRIEKLRWRHRGEEHAHTKTKVLRQLYTPSFKIDDMGNTFKGCTELRLRRVPRTIVSTEQLHQVREGSLPGRLPAAKITRLSRITKKLRKGWLLQKIWSLEYRKRAQKLR